MNQQDEALKLANEYRQTMPYDVMKDWGADVAVELRRQYQEIQELKKAKTELLEFAQRLGDVPCPLEVYVWLYKYNILGVREAVIAKYKD